MGIVYSYIEQNNKEYNQEQERIKQIKESLNYYKLRDIQRYFNNKTNLPSAILYIRPYVNYSNYRTGKIRGYTNLYTSDNNLAFHLDIHIGIFDNAYIGLTKTQCVALGLIKLKQNSKHMMK